MTNDEYYQEPGPRDGEMKPISDTLRRPEKICDIDCRCQKCGETYTGELFKWPSRKPRANYPGAFEDVWTERVLGEGLCPVCRQEKLEEDRKSEEAARQNEVMRRRRAYRESCGIGPKFLNEDFSTFDLEGLPAGIKKAYEIAWKYAEEFPIIAMGKGYRSMVLFSESSWGVGKTHLVCAIAHRILDRWDGSPAINPVRFISEPDLLLQITATYNFSPEERQYRESEADIIGRLLYVPLLIIDDVGKRKVADPRFVQRILFSIINGRYNLLKPVILTANLDLDGLQQYLGGARPERDDEGDEATFDRLAEMCDKFTRLDGESFRRKKRGKAPKGGKDAGFR